MMRYPKVYIVVLNYNSWKDTVECIESLFKLEIQHYQIILVDNNSTDDSIPRLKGWINGTEKIHLERNPILKDLSFPQKPKPISCLYNPSEMEQKEKQADIVFLTSDTNLGYAGGNNL